MTVEVGDWISFPVGFFVRLKIEVVHMVGEVAVITTNERCVLIDDILEVRKKERA